MRQAPTLARTESPVNNTSTRTHERSEYNTLLAALSDEDYQRLRKDLELVPMSLGQVLHESGETMSHIYFPVDCIVSILYQMENGASAEIALVGNEGVVGIAVFMGGESTMSRAVVQNAGHAYRLKAQVAKQEFMVGGALSRVLMMFTSAMITQMVQTAACNRHHTLDQQLCRWILLSLDRLPSRHIAMTEKLIGNMLGLKPVQVIAQATLLQKTGLVTYRDGEISVIDRAGIEKRACECYRVVKKETDRLLPLSASKP